MPSLTALRAFSALAQTGSAQAAGTRLNVSHAAISQQVKALEAHMGLALKRRADVVNDGGYPDKILANAPDTREGFFAVPKVVE